MTVSAGSIGRSTNAGWRTHAWSARTIDSPAGPGWNGFSFQCGSTSGYKVIGLTSATPSTTMNHGDYDYGYVCRPNGQVTFLTPYQCSGGSLDSGQAQTSDGDAMTSASTSDVFAVKFNAAGQLEFRINGVVGSPTCAPLGGAWPQPTRFPLRLAGDIMQTEDPSLKSITWLAAADA